MMLIVPFLVLGAAIPDGVIEPIKGLSVFVLGIATYYAIKEEKTLETIVAFSLAGLFLYIPGYGYPYGDGFMIAAIIVALLSVKSKCNLKIVNKIMGNIAKHSYAIYLLHPLFISAIKENYIRSVCPLGGIVYFILILVLTIITAQILDGCLYVGDNV